MQHFFKKAAALALAMVMALSLASVAFAADFPDMPDDWSTAALEAAVENGLISGKDGKIAASDSLTRAEMATIITRAFNAEVEDDISFTDVKNDTWYKTYAAKAVHMGAMNGKGSAFAGADSITRQEVFVVLARVLKLADGDAADLAAFSDADKTASWAVPAVAALVKAGYVSGSNGALNPTASITRAEFSQVMYNIFHNAYLTKAGTYEEVDGDNVIISSTNVTVKGVDVKGDVVVADGVGNGDVYFEDVTIGGRLVVRGGGMNSIHFKDSKTGTVIMSKVDGNVRLVITGESTVETVTVEAGKASTDVRVEGTVGTVVVNDNASTVVLADATVAKVEVNKANTTVSLAGKTTVAEMTVAAGATDTQLQAEPTAEITKLETAEDVFIDHEDVIKDCNDDEKVNPERPEESAAPSESKAPSEDVGTAKHTHTFTTTEVVVNGVPTQKEVAAAFDAQYHTLTCSVCGANIKRTHELDAEGHCTAQGCTYVKHVVTIPAASGGTEDTTGAAANCVHEYTGEATITKQPTCGKPGEAVYHCTKTEGCGATKKVELAATGEHSYDAGRYVDNAAKPTCVAAGTLTHYCTKCTVYNEDGTVNTGACGTGYSKTSQTSKTAHTLASGWQSGPSQHWRKCTNAAHSAEEGKVTDTAVNHVWGAWKHVVVEGANKHYRVCTVCGYGEYNSETHTSATLAACTLREDNNWTCPDCKFTLAHKDTVTDNENGTHNVVCNHGISGHNKTNEACKYGDDGQADTCSVCGSANSSKHALAALTARCQSGTNPATGFLSHRQVCKCSAGANCTVVKPGAWTKCTFSDGACTTAKCTNKHAATAHVYNTTVAEPTGKCTLCDVAHSCGDLSSADWESNAVKHWHACPTCGKHADDGVHTGGTTGADGKKECSTCHTRYGEHTCTTFDQTTHRCTECGTLHSCANADFNKTTHKCTKCGADHASCSSTQTTNQFHQVGTDKHCTYCTVCGKDNTTQVVCGSTGTVTTWTPKGDKSGHTGQCVCGRSVTNDTACTYVAGTDDGSGNITGGTACGLSGCSTAG